MRRRRGAKSSEIELGEALVSHLESEGWDIYQEVEIRGWPCDLVAVDGPVLMAVEIKTALNLTVLEQAYRWRRYANLVIAAVPSRHYFSCSHGFVKDACDALGVGLVTVRPDAYRGDALAKFVIRGDLLRRVDPALRDALKPEHKTAAPAGTNAGGRWTAYKETCRALAALVQERPGVTVREAVDAIRTHYASKASARGTLAKRTLEGAVPGVRIERADDGKLRLYPSAEPRRV